MLGQLMERAFMNHVDGARQRLSRALVGLEHGLRIPQQRLAQVEQSLNRELDGQWLRTGIRVTGQERVLLAYNPRAILKRGYAIVRREGMVVTVADELRPGQTIMLELGQGQRQAEITE